MNIQHSARTDNWGSPPDVVEAAREVLGAFDLDPASDGQWNQTVNASQYYSQNDNGLLHPWHGRVWINPPGAVSVTNPVTGKRKIEQQSLVTAYWVKLMEEVGAGHVREAIFLAFSIESFQSTQGKEVRPILDFPFCVPAKRLRFVNRGVEKSAPSHSNAVVYVPGTDDNTDRFERVFSKFGKVRR